MSGLNPGLTNQIANIASVHLVDINDDVINPATEDTLSTLTVRSTFSHGSKSSISTTAVQMKASSVPANNGVMVKADISNTGKVYVGSSSGVTNGSSDTTDGFQLNAGDGVVITVDNANDIWLIGSSAGQKVYWIAL